VTRPQGKASLEGVFVATNGATPAVNVLFTQSPGVGSGVERLLREVGVAGASESLLTMPQSVSPRCAGISDHDVVALTSDDRCVTARLTRRISHWNRHDAAVVIKRLVGSSYLDASPHIVAPGFERVVTVAHPLSRLYLVYDQVFKSNAVECAAGDSCNPYWAKMARRFRALTGAPQLEKGTLKVSARCSAAVCRMRCCACCAQLHSHRGCFGVGLC
jgi:hypothetical protein